MRSWFRPSFLVLLLTPLLALLLVAAMPGAVRAIRTELGTNLPEGPSALRYGDRGPRVERLQRLLAQKGYKPGPIDGIFGPLTRSAVERAQTAMQLEADGIAGRLTLSALKDSVPAEAGEEVPAQITTAVLEEGAPTALAPAAGLARETAAKGVALATESGLVIHQVAPERTRTEKAELKEFALTFNGVPDPEILPRILALLERERMEATFFISGRAAVLRPELVMRIAAAGHELGNGGLEAIDMSRLSPDMVQAQLTNAQRLIATASGQRPAFFRPPFGRFGGTLTAGARAVGLKTALWSNLFAGDEPGTADLVDHVYPGAVVMLHQDRLAAPDRLESAVVELARRGYTSVRLSRLSSCEVCR